MMTLLFGRGNNEATGMNIIVASMDEKYRIGKHVFHKNVWTIHRRVADFKATNMARECLRRKWW